jgi:CheY-like chemotaxis protein
MRADPSTAANPPNQPGPAPVPAREDQFLATLAHELRNPLAPMRHCVSILQRASNDDGAARNAIDVLDRQLRKMVRLVDELLDVSRITRGQVSLHRERIELGAVLDAAVETARGAIDAAGHRLTVERPAPPLWLHADPMRLAQVVANLLDNAARFTEPGGAIRLSARREGEAAVITVLDSGVGISADALPGVFDVFTQADGRAIRADNGLGLGLALVRSLVQLHGGTVGATSRGAGQGSEFTVRLPLHEGAAADPDATDAARPGVRGRRILVVDDNRDAADTLAMLLKLEGAEVDVAYDGPTALDKIDHFRPRAVVLDLGMPGMSGYEVARWIRDRRELDRLALIALTGFGQDADRRMTAEAGFDHHLTKPADIDTVQAVLSSLP